ncbi:DUF4244 domain-containing protein [Streptomyces sp. NPDC049597]|uniref:DUF4244 domain-containing protein n=1 Tax=Streptomyces sp. NPDC049597 TaxID=3155276 RepID=UPI00343D5C77
MWKTLWHRLCESRADGGGPLGGRLGGLRRRLAGLRTDKGMTTSEYAVGTIAACGFAAVLYKVVTSDAVSKGLQALIGKALDAQF